MNKNALRTLAIETSSRTGSVALGCDEHVLGARLEGERAHAADLLPRIDGLFASMSDRRAIAVDDVELVAVGIGPGSFTGIRIGIATAQGLARATGARLIGVPSFDALAFHELAPGEEGSTVLDARAGRFYFARYRRTETDVETLVAPTAIAASELRDRLVEDGRILADDRVARQAELDGETRERLETASIPRAVAVLELARMRDARRSHGRIESDSGDECVVEPLYLFAFGKR